MENSDLKLSPSEKRTLQQLAQGEFQVTQAAGLDWVALQRLKTWGFAQERSAGGMAITEEGRRAMRRLISKH